MCARFTRAWALGLGAASIAAGSALAAPKPAPLGTMDRSLTDKARESIDVELRVGEQRVLSSSKVRSYSEGIPNIVRVRLTQEGDSFVVLALQPGKTSLLFLMTDGSEMHYNITVVDPDAAPAAADTETPEEKKPAGVEARDNIRLDFYFVQLDKAYNHQIGIGWPGSVAPEFSAAYNVKDGGLDSATAVISDQALPRLDMAQGSGWAKILRQAAVVVANGEQAEFAGGGEVNIPVEGSLSTGIHKIPFGSTVRVEPHYDAQTGRIELRIHADVSELDAGFGTGAPGRRTSTLDTVVNIELSQSLVLGGLSAKTERHNQSGLPLLSQIPILGALFGTNTVTEANMENVVVIVPTVVDAVSMQDRRRIKEALAQYEEYTGDLDEVRFVPEAKGSARRPRGR